MIRYGISLSLNRIVPLVRNAVIANRDFDLQAGIQVVTQHFSNAPTGGTIARRCVGDSNQDNLPGGGTIELISGDQYVLADARIVWAHKMYATLTEVTPHQLGGFALDNIDQCSFRTTAAISPGNSH